MYAVLCVRQIYKREEPTMIKVALLILKPNQTKYMKTLSFIMGTLSLVCFIVSTHLLINDGPGPAYVHLFLVLITFLTTLIYLANGIYEIFQGKR